MRHELWSVVQDQIDQSPLDLAPDAEQELRGIVERGSVVIHEQPAEVADPMHLAEQRLRLIVDAAANQARVAHRSAIDSQILYDALKVIPTGFWPFIR